MTWKRLGLYAAIFVLGFGLFAMFFHGCSKQREGREECERFGGQMVQTGRGIEKCFAPGAFR